MAIRHYPLLLATVLAATILPFPRAYSEPAVLSSPLTASVLVEAVLAANPGLKAHEAAAAAAAFRIAPAGALEDPTLSYGAAPETLDGRRGLQQRLELSQALPWPGKRSLRETRASAEAQAEQQSTADRRLELTALAKQLYAEWLYIHQSLQLKREHLALLGELQQVAASHYAAGRAPQQDALQAAVATTRVDADIIAHQRQQRDLQALINALLNRPPQQPLPPPALPPPGKSPRQSLPIAEPAELPDSASLQAAALQTHPAIQRLRARTAAAEAHHELARKAYYPDFRLSAGYNELWDSADKRFTVGLSINLPFDFSGKLDAAADAAQAELMRARWQLNDRETQLLAELEQSRSHLLEKQALIELQQRRLLPLARQSLEAAIANYRAGQGSFLAVIDAHRQHLRSEDELQRARADYQKHWAQLERLAGQPLSGDAHPQPPQHQHGDGALTSAPIARDED